MSNMGGSHNRWILIHYYPFSIISAVIVLIVFIATLVESKIDADDAKYSNKNNNNNNNNNGMQMKETKKNGSKSGGDTQITVMSSEYSGKGFKDGLEIMKESELNSSGRKCPSEQSKTLT